LGVVKICREERTFAIAKNCNLKKGGRNHLEKKPDEYNFLILRKGVAEKKKDPRRRES